MLRLEADAASAAALRERTEACSVVLAQPSAQPSRSALVRARAASAALEELARTKAQLARTERGLDEYRARAMGPPRSAVVAALDARAAATRSRERARSDATRALCAQFAARLKASN